MPLIKSGSKAAVSTNIREMMEAGHPQKQAVAAALSNARKYGAKYQFGGAAGMPFGMGASRPMPGAGMGAAVPAAPAIPSGPMLRGALAAMPAPWQLRPGMGGMARGGVPRMQGGGTFEDRWAPVEETQRAYGMQGKTIGDVVKESYVKDYMKRKALNIPWWQSMNRGGVPRMQMGGLPIMPWFARQEARNITHGFLHSPVPGRTDQLPIGVKAGSYVLPADHMAAIGQGNNLAGAAKVSKMFGMTPAGTPPMHAGRAFHMPNLPRPPRLPTAKAPTMAEGGTGKPTKIVAAGGEYVIPPEAIIRKYGNLKKGHAELDKWVINTRRKHVKTLKTLKPPKGA